MVDFLDLAVGGSLFNRGIPKSKHTQERLGRSFTPLEVFNAHLKVIRRFKRLSWSVYASDNEACYG